VNGSRKGQGGKRWFSEPSNKELERPSSQLRSRISRDTMKNARNPESSAYASWFAALRDRAAKVRIDIRIRRLSLGNFGDIRPVGEGVSELRIHYGPGYRIYLKKQGDALVILLAGGDKSSQDQDIQFARELARNL